MNRIFLVLKINKQYIVDKLMEYYQVTSKFTFDKLDTPGCIYQQREKEFRKYREEKIDFIKFEYENKMNIETPFFVITSKCSSYNNSKLNFEESLTC